MSENGEATAEISASDARAAGAIADNDGTADTAGPSGSSADPERDDADAPRARTASERSESDAVAQFTPSRSTTTNSGRRWRPCC